MSSSLSRNWLLSLVAIVCLAALLRLPNLGRSSLWLDECHTVNVAQAVRKAPFARVVSAVTRGLSSYFVLLAPLVRPDPPEWAVRLPSALAGITLPVVLAVLGKDLGGIALGRRLGIAAAISPLLVWHSREARWYPYTWLFVGLGALCFVRARWNGDWRWIGGCVLAGLVAASTYAPAIVVLLIELAWLGFDPQARDSLSKGWRAVGRRTGLILGGVLAGGLLVAGVWIWRTLAGPALFQGARGFGFYHLGGPTPGSVGYTGIAYATGYTLGPGPSEWHVLKPRDLLGLDGTLLFLGVGAFGVLVVLGAAALLRTHGVPLGMAMLTLAAAPPLMVLAAGLWTDHAYAPRHVGMAYPFALLLGVAAIGNPPRRRLTGALAVLLLGLQTVSLWNLHTNPRHSREDVRSAARYVAERAEPGDLVLIFGGLDLQWRHYYRGAGATEMLSAKRQDGSDERRLRAELDERRTVWTVRGRLWDKPGSERLIALVEDRAPATERREFPGSVMVSLHRPGGQAPGLQP